MAKLQRAHELIVDEFSIRNVIDKNLQTDIWNTHCLSRNVFAGLHASASTSFRSAQVKKAHDGKCPGASKHGGTCCRKW